MVEAKSRTDIFIATPMYGGMCYGTYNQSFARLVDIFLREKRTFKYGVKYNESLVTRARDLLAADFMQSDSTHLMFIDADIEFRAEDIISMAEADKDVICGLYPRKGIDWEQVAQAVNDGVPAKELFKHTGSFPVNTLDGKNITEVVKSLDEHEPIEVRNGPTGFMLIKREVLEKLSEKVPEYLTNGEDPSKPRVCKQYFDTSINPDDNTLLSEDYHFCKLARDNGFKIWAAPWAYLPHTGTFMYSGRPYPSA